jgi:hypothetical protein
MENGGKWKRKMNGMNEKSEWKVRRGRWIWKEWEKAGLCRIGANYRRASRVKPPTDNRRPNLLEEREWSEKRNEKTARL